MFCPLSRADTIQVGVKTVGDNTSFVSLETDVTASQQSLWRWLTDYNHHAGFLPYVSKSQIIGKIGDDLLVDQAGTIKILFWSYTMKMKQRVTEVPPHRMHFQTVEGDFDRLEGDFFLTPRVSERPMTHLECGFTVKPKRHVPDWAVRMAAKHYLRKMVEVLAQKAEAQP